MSGALREIAVKRSDVFWIDPRELQVKPEWNSRNFNSADNKEHIASLKLSIKHIGVREPLTVTRDSSSKIYITDGHCRHQAVLELLDEGVEIKAVPVKTEGKEANEADALLRQALDGKPKTAIELRHIFKRLLGYGWTEQDIANKSGKGLQSVRAALEFDSAPPVVQKMVESGLVSPTLANKVYHKEGAKAAETLSNAANAARQKGKTKVTEADIGTAPTEVRKSRITQLKEIVEIWDWNETEEGWCSVTITDSERMLLFKLLDI